MQRRERGLGDGWRLVKRGDDLWRMVWLGTDGEVDPCALERVFGFWHSDLLPLDRIYRINGQIELYSAPFRAPLERLPEPLAVRASDSLRLAHDSLVTAADLRGVADLVGRPLVVPPPELWVTGREPSNSVALRPRSVVQPGLRFIWRGDLREVAAQALSAAAVGPHAVVFYGEPGIGKSRLLDLIGFDAGWQGVRVVRHFPADLAASRKPLVVLLDDLAPEPGDGIARAAAVAERLSRPLVVFATAGPEFDAARLPGLTVDGVPLTRLTPAELLAAVQPATGLPECDWLAIAGLCDGSPRTLRLMLTLAAVGQTPRDPEAAVAVRLSGLSADARRGLYSLNLLPEGAEPARIAAIAGGEPPWHELDPFVQVVGARVKPLVGLDPARLAVPELTAAAIRLRAADHLTAPCDARLRARLLAASGDAEAALATVTPDLAAVEPRAALAVLAELQGAGLALAGAVRARQAELCVAVGEGDGALAILAELVVEGGPDVDVYRLRRAELLEVAGMHVEADGELGLIPLAMLTNDPSLGARAHYLSGRLAEARGDLDRARVDYQHGLSRAAEESHRAVGLTALGRLHLRLADGRGRGDLMLAEARDLFIRIGSRKGVAEVCRLQADAALGFGDRAAAAELLQQALEASLADDDRVGAAEAHAGLARAALAAGRLAVAERHLTLALGYLTGLEQPDLKQRLQIDRAAIWIDLGRPRAAEPLLRTARAGLVSDPPSTRLAARLALLLGRAALSRGDLEQAEAELADGLALSRSLANREAEAECELALAWCHLDGRDPAAALRAAEAGLRALAPVGAGLTVTALKIVVAHAELETAGPAKAARVISELALGLDDAEPSHLTAVLGLLAAVAIMRGDAAAAGPAFERAIEAGERQECPDILARVIATGLRGLGEELDGPRTAALLERLRDLHIAPDRRGRLRLLGVPAALHPTPAPAVLSGEALGQLDRVLRRVPTDAGGHLGEALEILRRKVPFTRAALVAQPDGGLQVIAAARSIAMPADGRGDALGLAIALGAAARLTRSTHAYPRLGAETTFAQHPETVAWGLGPALAAVSRGDLVLYLDRVRSLPPFAEEEIRFAEAFVERISLESTRRPLAEQRVLLTNPEAGDLGLIGVSATLARVRRELRRLGPFDIPVFLHGESGTGKELAATALHRLSRRAEGPFVPLNCAAITETLIESELFGYVKGSFSGAVADREGLLARASGGTLFLDEIAELSPAFQAKLLRVVELGEYRPVGSTVERSTDVRIISATNRDMEAEVRAGRFREDLYYRLLSTATVEIPPLRARAGDVSILAGRFAIREAERHDTPVLRFSPRALGALERYPFPGNVRELERLVCGLVARCGSGEVELDDLPIKVRDEPTPLGTFGRARTEFEQRYVRDLLERHGGNRTHAARTAGMARQTLIKMIRRLDCGDDEGGDVSGGAECPPRPRAGSSFRVGSPQPKPTSTARDNGHSRTRTASP